MKSAKKERITIFHIKAERWIILGLSGMRWSAIGDDGRNDDGKKNARIKGVASKNRLEHTRNLALLPSSSKEPSNVTSASVRARFAVPGDYQLTRPFVAINFQLQRYIRPMLTTLGNSSSGIKRRMHDATRCKCAYKECCHVCGCRCKSNASFPPPLPPVKGTRYRTHNG